MARKKREKKEKMAPKIAKGAAAISVAAGVVAAGVALSDEETRSKLGEGAKQAMGSMREVASDFREDPQRGYQTVQHKINKGARKLKNTKAGEKAKELKEKRED